MVDEEMNVKRELFTRAFAATWARAMIVWSGFQAQSGLVFEKTFTHSPLWPFLAQAISRTPFWLKLFVHAPD